jgi:hypothetical protein
MAGESDETSALHKALDEVLSSDTLRGSKRLREILNYILEQHFKGLTHRLNQKAIGCEIFGLPPADTQDYVIVRRSLNELRKKLAVYYSGEGKESRIRVSIPPGSYTPVFENMPPVDVSGSAPKADEKQGKEPVEQAPRWLRTFQWKLTALFCLAGAIIAFLAISALLTRLHRASLPAKIRAEGNTLFVFDAEERFLWSSTLAAPQKGPIKIVDLDGDGYPEVLASTGTPRTGEWAGRAGILFCFGRKGKELWRLTLVDPEKVPFEDPLFHHRGPYELTDLIVDDLDGDRTPDIVAKAEHIDGFGARILRIGNKGEIIASYWHPGHIQYLEATDMTGNGKKEILFGGSHRGYGRSPVLAVLDISRMEGTGPAERETRFEAPGVPVADHLAYMLLPRCEPTLEYPRRDPRVRMIRRHADGTLQVWTEEDSRCAPLEVGAVYVFTGRLELLKVEFSDSMRAAYQACARETGSPPPDFGALASRLGAEVRLWREGGFAPLAAAAKPPLEVR